MTAQQAMNYIAWRMNNSWRTNEKDFEALNIIQQLFEQKAIDHLGQNDRYLKLFAYVLMAEAKRLEVPIPSEDTQKSTERILKLDLEYIIEKMTRKINEGVAINIIAKYRDITKHPVNYIGSKPQLTKEEQDQLVNNAYSEAEVREHFLQTALKMLNDD